MHIDGEQSLLLCCRNFPLIRKLQKQLLIDRKKYKNRLHKNKDLLQGKRGIRFPLISLSTQRDMGPYRHALSQKVVGGTMVVHPPFKPNNTHDNFLNHQLTINSRSKFWRNNG